MKRLILSVGLVSCVLVAIIVGVLDSSVILPAVVPTGADPTSFSGARAMEHLESIAVGPRPWYSEENERVFRYILSHGDSLASRYGADVIETSAQTLAAESGSHEGALIANVAFLIKGWVSGTDGGAIQVSAHYDGVSRGPAASDDGAGCAVALEVASVLASRSFRGEGLRRDVLLLFVDAEEVGLVGAKAWAWGAGGRLDGASDPWPWSALPSFAINMEASGTATSGAMLIRSNSRFATDMYRKHAPHPKAASLTEWIYKTISIGGTDSNIYWTQGIHLMDLIWVENRWAYHSAGDDIEHVRPASLQSCGENVLAIVAGASASVKFPGRIPRRELVQKGVIESEGGVGMDSGTVYFSMLGGTMIWIPSAAARALYIALAIFMGLTTPLVRIRGPAPLAETASRHALVALLNLALGIAASVASFAAFGAWKAPAAEELPRSWYGGANAAWGGRGVARSILSLFATVGAAFLVYAPFRGVRPRGRGDDGSSNDTMGGNSIRLSTFVELAGPPSQRPAITRSLKQAKTFLFAAIHWVFAPPAIMKPEKGHPDRHDYENLPTGSSRQAFDDDVSIHSGIEACDDKDKQTFSSIEAPDGNEKQNRLEQLGRDAHVGIFFFYDMLLLLLGGILPDAACLVLWQPICLWIASLFDAHFHLRIGGNGECMGREHSTGRFGRWLPGAFLTAFSSLLLLPTVIYLLINCFGYFMDDLGIWYGAPVVDSSCFGLILPLFAPSWLPLPRKVFLVLCSGVCLAWAAAAIACVAI